VVAKLVKVIPRENGASIVVGGVHWIRLLALDGEGARIEPFAIDQDGEARVDELRSIVRNAVKSLPHPEPMLRRIEAMSALELADATVANAPGTVDAKAAYAAEPRLSARIDRALAFVGG
jgi:hypothetical protein